MKREKQKRGYESQDLQRGPDIWKFEEGGPVRDALVVGHTADTPDNGREADVLGTGQVVQNNFVLSFGGHVALHNNPVPIPNVYFENRLLREWAGAAAVLPYAAGVLSARMQQSIKRLSSVRGPKRSVRGLQFSPRTSSNNLPSAYKCPLATYVVPLGSGIKRSIELIEKGQPSATDWEFRHLAGYYGPLAINGEIPESF